MFIRVSSIIPTIVPHYYAYCLLGTVKNKKKVHCSISVLASSACLQSCRYVCWQFTRQQVDSSLALSYSFYLTHFNVYICLSLCSPILLHLVRFFLNFFHGRVHYFVSSLFTVSLFFFLRCRIYISLKNFFGFSV